MPIDLCTGCSAECESTATFSTGFSSWAPTEYAVSLLIGVLDVSLVVIVVVVMIVLGCSMSIQTPFDGFSVWNGSLPTFNSLKWSNNWKSHFLLAPLVLSPDSSTVRICSPRRSWWTCLSCSLDPVSVCCLDLDSTLGNRTHASSSFWRFSFLLQHTVEYKHDELLSHLKISAKSLANIHLHYQPACTSVLHAQPQTPGTSLEDHSFSPSAWQQPADWIRQQNSKHTVPHACSVLQMSHGRHWRPVSPLPMLSWQSSLELLLYTSLKMYTFSRNLARPHRQVKKDLACSRSPAVVPQYCITDIPLCLRN